MSGHVYLVGMPGTGKTEVGKVVGERLGLAFVDLDAEVIADAGRSVDEIFRREGEEGFRERERHVLSGCASGERSVIACGGGTVLDAENRAVIHSTGTVVFLETPLDVLATRLDGFVEGRPLLEEPGALAELFEERTPLYAEIADVQIDGEGPVASVADAVVEALG